MVKAVIATPKPAKGAAVPATAAPVEIDLVATEAAWKKHEPAFRALSRAEVIAASLDVTQAASVAIAATKNVLARRAQLETLFREAPVARFEAVLEIALAVQHGDLLHRVSQDKTSLFADIFPRMTELRGLLLDDLDIQVKRGKCPAKFVSDLRLGDRDAADFANDLNDAAAWYLPHLGTELRTTISSEDVAEARKLAATALARLAAQLVPHADEALSTSELRARGFTVLAREYDAVRQYGAFVFWSAPEGWESYVPSLWVGRNTQGAAVKTDPTPPVEPKPPTG